MAEEEDQDLLPLVPSLMGHSLQWVAFSNLVQAGGPSITDHCKRIISSPCPFRSWSSGLVS